MGRAMECWYDVGCGRWGVNGAQIGGRRNGVIGTPGMGAPGMGA
eukprot:CAMPEP_0184391540 /NCGR_PEP_ID=MMETSP0007-20130409/14184_1 /TAXON_ID=97485 /ORGANISM="Prymnesium parvum, Strain Texoma1" /LENGTH=43 /DNA_ID= /DNA_START= /DNA_END= /DNA_ORIENTATION=